MERSQMRFEINDRSNCNGRH